MMTADRPIRYGAFCAVILGLAGCNLAAPSSNSKPISLVDMAMNIPSASPTQARLDVSKSRLLIARQFAQDTDPIIQFAPQSAELTPMAQHKLDAQVAWMLQNIEYKFDLYGYAETQTTPTEPLVLGQQRAQIVQTYFLNRGISADRLRLMKTDASYASAGRQDQRRVVTELRVTP